MPWYISKIAHFLLSNNHSINHSKLLFINKILITVSPFDLIRPESETKKKIANQKPSIEEQKQTKNGKETKNKQYQGKHYTENKGFKNVHSRKSDSKVL